jgi:hypothetical protein
VWTEGCESDSSIFVSYQYVLSFELEMSIREGTKRERPHWLGHDRELHGLCNFLATTWEKYPYSPRVAGAKSLRNNAVTRCHRVKPDQTTRRLFKARVADCERYATLSFLPPPSLPTSLRCPQARFRWVSYFSDSLGGRSLNGHIIAQRALALALPLGALGRGDRGSTMLTVWPNALTACTECRAPPSRRPSMSDRHEALTVPG